MSLAEHLGRGVTTVARAWAVKRRDGTVLGFTDHDRDLAFEDILFRASSGMTAQALELGTGLAVDNTEALGVLSDASLSEVDILAGRYDGAEVRIWWVNWADPAERELRFRGSLGEIARHGGSFRAELRGLTEPFGRMQGRIYHSACSAVLGDAACRFDLSKPGHAVDLPILEARDGGRFIFAGAAGYPQRWFEKGFLRMLGGAAAGLEGLIKADIAVAGSREIVLWQRLGVAPMPGDVVRLIAGCDKRAETCRSKFNNFLNFRGFPHMPGEDWVISVPRDGDVHDGGSLKR
jgi:uncharacterized phage protein (TIGR02218 family)